MRAYKKLFRYILINIMADYTKNTGVIFRFGLE